jgi:ABC-type multidrug transport system ATPase subunit
VGLSWKGVTISTKDTVAKGVTTAGRTILDNVSGCAAAGEFISIIGASGAGKTTFLNHLSGRLLANNLQKTGVIQVNGVDRDKVEGFGEFSGYV